MVERYPVRMDIGQDLPRHPGSRLLPGWVQRFGLILLVLLVTAVRGDGQATLSDSASASPQFKPALTQGPSPQERIVQQLQARNTLGVRFIIPSQGSRLEF